MAGSSAASPPPRTGSDCAEGTAAGITGRGRAARASSQSGRSLGASPGATSARPERSASASKAHRPTSASAMYSVASSSRTAQPLASGIVASWRSTWAGIGERAPWSPLVPVKPLVPLTLLARRLAVSAGGGVSSHCSDKPSLPSRKAWSVCWRGSR